MALSTITSPKAFAAATGSGTILVDFKAPWCTPCRMQEPILKKIADRFDGRVEVSTINIDNHPDIAKDMDIQSIPTLIIFRRGKEIRRFVGLQSENALVEALERLSKLMMAS